MVNADYTSYEMACGFLTAVIIHFNKNRNLLIKVFKLKKDKNMPVVIDHMTNKGVGKIT